MQVEKCVLILLAADEVDGAFYDPALLLVLLVGIRARLALRGAHRFLVEGRVFESIRLAHHTMVSEPGPRILKRARILVEEKVAGMDTAELVPLVDRDRVR